jgi:hypothetical protein
MCYIKMGHLPLDVCLFCIIEIDMTLSGSELGIIECDMTISEINCALLKLI